jgi:hypothetical protein
MFNFWCLVHVLNLVGLSSERQLYMQYGIWRSRDRASLMYSIKYTNKMQCYTVFFITVNALHVSGGFCAHHQWAQNCTHSIWYIAWVSCSNSPTLSVAASKLDIYQMLCVQFWAHWWWAQKPPETCRALTVIKNTV